MRRRQELIEENCYLGNSSEFYLVVGTMKIVRTHITNGHSKYTHVSFFFNDTAGIMNNVVPFTMGT